MQEERDYFITQQLLEAHRDDLQKTASEQDIVDGGTGEEVYRFTTEDARHPGWGADGDNPDNAVWKLFKK